MNNFDRKDKLFGWFIRVLPLVIVLFAGAIAADAQIYPQKEETCFNMVQGRVAYNQAGDKNWKESNVRLLCRGTTLPERTVECFRVKIANGKRWDQAIEECKPETMIGNPGAGSTKLNLVGNWEGYYENGVLTGQVWTVTQSGVTVTFTTRNNLSPSFSGRINNDAFTRDNGDTGVISPKGNVILFTDRRYWMKGDNLSQGAMNSSNSASGTTPTAGSMTKVAGSAYDLDVSAKGVVWSIGTAPRGGGFGPIGKLNYSSFNDAGLRGGSWSNVAGEAARIAVDNNGYAWVVNQQGNIYFYGNQWTPVSGAARDIACNARGDLWILDAQGDARLFDPATKQWGRKSLVPLNGNEIAVDAQGFPWVINIYSRIIYKDGGNWVTKPGTAKSIAAGGGRVWMIDNSTSALMLWNGSNWEKKHNGPFKRVAADGEGKPWVIAEGGIVYRLNL